MVRAGNGYRNFAYRDVERCDAGIERRLGDDTTGAPNVVTGDGGREDGYGYDDYKICAMVKFDGRIDESQQSDEEQNEEDDRKAYRVEREPGPNGADQQKQWRSEKRDLSKHLYLERCNLQ